MIYVFITLGIWLLPALLFVIVVYWDLHPGETLSEYNKYTDMCEWYGYCFIPLANYVFLCIWIGDRVWIRIKDKRFKK